MNTKIATILLLLSLSLSVNAQYRKLQNLPYTDRRIFHLGFTIGLNAQDLILTHSGNINDNGEMWFAEIPKFSPGFAVGLIGDIYISNYLNFRILPTLHLGDKLFIFKEQISGKEFSTRIRNNYISIPAQIKISARRTDNFRPYLLIGGYSSIELSRNKGLAILLKQNDFGIEIGTGCDLYLPMFKLAPELKFSFGLIDILDKERSDLKDQELLKYANAISMAKSRMITLCLNFE